jgi:curved DNA-binding protein
MGALVSLFGAIRNLTRVEINQTLWGVGSKSVKDGNQRFIDYYSILLVHPSCDTEILDSAYRHLAKLHHPDHSGEEDTSKFDEVIKAYKVLRNPDQRAEYDKIHAQNRRQDWDSFSSFSESSVYEESALSDAESHEKILNFLYDKRRQQAKQAGVVAFHLQEILNCSDDQFEFHKWYLKEKGFITLSEQGTLEITVQGVDHIILTSRTTRAAKLLISQS